MDKPNDDLGFKPKERLDISGFSNTPVSSTRRDEEAADRTADRQGFVSREAVGRVERTRKMKEPMDHAYVRGPLSLINRFKNYCNETGLSYGEALDELMKKAGI